MKQHISEDQLNELTPRQKEKLRDWWNPQEGDMCHYQDYYDKSHTEPVAYHDSFCCGGDSCDYNRKKDGLEIGKDVLPILSIGQMIEFLEEKGWLKLDIGEIDSGNGFIVLCTKGIPAGTWFVSEKSICDALWGAVKEAL